MSKATCNTACLISAISVWIAFLRNLLAKCISTWLSIYKINLDSSSRPDPTSIKTLSRKVTGSCQRENVELGAAAAQVDNTENGFAAFLVPPFSLLFKKKKKRPKFLYVAMMMMMAAAAAAPVLLSLWFCCGQGKNSPGVSKREKTEQQPPRSLLRLLQSRLFFFYFFFFHIFFVYYFFLFFFFLPVYNRI